MARVNICRAGMKIDSARLTDSCITFLDKVAVSLFTKNLYD